MKKALFFLLYGLAVFLFCDSVIGDTLTGDWTVVPDLYVIITTEKAITFDYEHISTFVLRYDEIQAGLIEPQIAKISFIDENLLKVHYSDGTQMAGIYRIRFAQAYQITESIVYFFTLSVVDPDMNQHKFSLQQKKGSTRILISYSAINTPTAAFGDSVIDWSVINSVLYGDETKEADSQEAVDSTPKTMSEPNIVPVPISEIAAQIVFIGLLSRVDGSNINLISLENIEH